MTEASGAAAPRRARQWVAMRNVSMDVRGGWGISGSAAKELRTAIGKPHVAALVGEGGVDPALVEALHRDLSASGFEVRRIEMPEGGCDLPRVEALDELLADAGVVAEDIVVAVGGYEALSVASFACGTWCGGVSLLEVPTSAPAALLCGPTPRALDLPGAPRMVSNDGAARFCVVDPGLFDCDPSHEELLHAFALMVATATCDSNKSFGRLWDSADALAAADPDALLDELLESIKGRGRVVSATSASTRQSISFGHELACALRPLVGPDVPESALLADGMRFAARLAVGLEQLSVDDMFTLDELLERLGVGTVEARVDPDALVAQIRSERFRRSNRFMVATPRALGRVRLSIVSDELLAEHAAAWCAAR